MLIGVIADPEHIVWVTMSTLTSGTGLTVTVTVFVELQFPPGAVAVIVKVVVIGSVELFMSVPLIGDPDPPAPIVPVRSAVWSLVQVKVVPAV